VHFNSSFNFTHPNIYSVIAELKKIQTETYIKINSLDAPFKFQNTKTKKKRELLERTLTKYKNKEISVSEYVKHMAFYLKK
jgi:hypothetical protein